MNILLQEHLLQQMLVAIPLLLSQVITVEDNTAPVISSIPAATTIECPATPSFATATATDACGTCQHYIY